MCHIPAQGGARQDWQLAISDGLQDWRPGSLPGGATAKLDRAYLRSPVPEWKWWWKESKRIILKLAGFCEEYAFLRRDLIKNEGFKF
jgi:hypothetical protein